MSYLKQNITKDTIRQKTKEERVIIKSSGEENLPGEAGVLG
jgi:hypothetical protein